MRIASNIIDTIKAKADIVEVIGEYVHYAHSIMTAHRH